MFMLMMPLLAVLSTLGIAGLMWGGFEKLNRVGYSYYLRQAQKNLDTLLADVDGQLRTRALLGNLSPPRAALPPREE